MYSFAIPLLWDSTSFLHNPANRAIDLREARALTIMFIRHRPIRGFFIKCDVNKFSDEINIRHKTIESWFNDMHFWDNLFGEQQTIVSQIRRYRKKSGEMTLSISLSSWLTIKLVKVVHLAPLTLVIICRLKDDWSSEEAQPRDSHVNFVHALRSICTIYGPARNEFDTLRGSWRAKSSEDLSYHRRSIVTYPSWSLSSR